MTDQPARSLPSQVASTPASASGAAAPMMVATWLQAVR